MGRQNFLVDRAIIVRPESGKTYGVRFKASDNEIGDWVPCRLRAPEGPVEASTHNYEFQPEYELHLAPFDLSGIRIKLRPSDVLRVYQRVNDYWVEYEAPFIIVGAIKLKRRRTRLMSYVVPVRRGAAPEF